MINKDIILSLISQKEESEICDFKQEWPSHLAGIIKDIVCFCNRVEDSNAYIIIGVRDSDKNIVGVENGKKRYNQAQLTENIRKVPFAESRPKISVDTIDLNGHELDVITIFNTKDTPLYLTKNEAGMNAGCIYTRVNDCNSPAGECVEPVLIQKLWMKRFNMLNRLNPKEQFFTYLKDNEKWVRGIDDSDDQDIETYYYIDNPLFYMRIKSSYEVTRRSFTKFSVTQFDPHVGYYYLYCYYGTIALQKFLIVSLDGARFFEIYPDEHLVKTRNKDFALCYFTRDSENWLVHQFLINTYHDGCYKGVQGRHEFINSIICFDSIEESRAFFDYLNKTFSSECIEPIEDFPTGGIGGSSEDRKKINDLKSELQYSLAVKKIYEKWRSQNFSSEKAYL